MTEGVHDTGIMIVGKHYYHPALHLGLTEQVRLIDPETWQGEPEINHIVPHRTP